MQPKLFNEYPFLEDDTLLLRRMSDADADALSSMCAEKEVYRYVPTFLYELRYEDKRTVIARMDEECFDTQESILLGVYLKDTGAFAGIAEFYAYEPDRRKCSIGLRLMKEYWGQGIAAKAISLMIRFLLHKAGIQIITGHIMQENKASAAAAMKGGMKKHACGIEEDWGFDHPVIVDEYIVRLTE